MKNAIFILGLLITMFLITSSCKDDLTNEAFQNGTATIQGIAYANLDLSNDLTGVEWEYVPSGTHIYAIIDSKDLVQNPSSNVSYGDIIYEAVVGENGSFTFTIEANIDSVPVEFESDEFTHNEIQVDQSTETEIYYLPDGYSESVRGGVIRYTEIYFEVEL